MRSISISTEVFARIWAQRIAGEEDEDAILRRLLGVTPPPKVVNASQPRMSPVQAHLWRHDVKAALVQLGGQAHLKQIYNEVRDIRRKNGRSVPANLEAIVRRELEHNSSDAKVFLGRHDWFRSVDGIGAGVWATRPESEE